MLAKLDEYPSICYRIGDCWEYADRAFSSAANLSSNLSEYTDASLERFILDSLTSGYAKRICFPCKKIAPSHLRHDSITYIVFDWAGSWHVTAEQDRQHYYHPVRATALFADATILLKSFPHDH